MFSVYCWRFCGPILLRVLQTSLRLRIAVNRSRQDRLTDLMVAGTINQADYDVGKLNAEFELQLFREEIKQHETRQKTEADLNDLLAMATNLGALFELGGLREQRALIRNGIDEMRVCRGELHIGPAQ